MKHLLTTFLVLLLALPWSAVTAGACPMRHAEKQVQSEPEQKPDCCSHKNAPESQTGNRHHAQSNKNGCSGDCCPVCHLVQDTPQAHDDIPTLQIYYPLGAAIHQEDSFTDYSILIHQSRFSFAALAPPLNMPQRIPLRI